MSAELPASMNTVPSAVAKKTNASKWPLFKRILGNLDDTWRFTDSANRLQQYLSNRKAYYQDARPEIVEVLESAAHAFETLSGTPGFSVDDIAISNAASHRDILRGDVACPARYASALESFRRIVATVYEHIEEFRKFPDNDIENTLVARLRPIFSTFIRDFHEPLAQQQLDPLPADEPPTSLHSPFRLTRQSSFLSETMSSAPINIRRLSMTSSRMTTPSVSSLLLPSTSSPSARPVTPAVQQLIDARYGSPETADHIDTADTLDDVEVISAANSVPAASPMSPSASLEHTVAVDVEMSDVLELDELADNDPVESTTEVERPHEHIESPQQSPAGDAPTYDSEPSQTFDIIDHTIVQPEEASIVEAAVSATAEDETNSLFGTDSHILCFERGRTSSSSFTMVADDIPFEPLRLWRDIKGEASQPLNISDCRCLSFVIYDAEDVMAQQSALPNASVNSWFRSARCISAGDINMRHISGTMGEHRLILPAFFATQETPFVDLSAWAKEGRNLLQISHAGDMSCYIFAVVLHRPTFAQEAKVQKSCTAREEWFGWSVCNNERGAP